MSRPCAAIAASVKRSASAPYSSMRRSGSMTLPFDLRHLRALLVANERVDIDVAEGDLVHEIEAHHHHPGDPEEDDVEAGDEGARRIIARELRRLLRPAERREGPERRGKPGVEHVFVARERHAIAAFGARRGKRRFFRLFDIGVAVLVIPGRDAMTPPELTRHAPGLDILQPLEIGLLPILRHESSCGPRARL